MDGNPPPEDNFLKTVNLTIHRRLDDPTLGVEDLSSAVHLTRSQVHRRLKAATGLNATQYIRSIRLNKAQELLKETPFPVSQIALDVGFSDPGFFSRVFKERFGMSPSHFRNNSKK